MGLQRTREVLSIKSKLSIKLRLLPIMYHVTKSNMNPGTESLNEALKQLYCTYYDVKSTVITFNIINCMYFNIREENT